MISPLAYIHPEAKIGENVEIAPFVFIDKNVVIGDNNKIMANANILYGSRIGNGNTIFPGAVIGAIPQDLKFRGEETTPADRSQQFDTENQSISRHYFLAELDAVYLHKVGGIAFGFVYGVQNK